MSDYRNPKVTTPKDDKNKMMKWIMYAIAAIIIILLLVWWLWPDQEVVPEAAAPAEVETVVPEAE